MNDKTERLRIPTGVAEKLGYYVYLYIDPCTDKPFYVGKGKGNRILAHIDDKLESDKTRMINELRKADKTERIDVLAHGLKDEETALRIEAAAIDLLGLGKLANKVRGWKSLQLGRMTLDELIGYYAAKPVNIVHPVLIIRINKLFRHNMSPLELYETTRGIWRLGPRREGAKYALSAFEGVVREVYEIHSWYTARTLLYETRDLSKRDVTGRWEFEGKVADEKIRNRYRNRSVKDYLRQGNQRPTVYVNV